MTEAMLGFGAMLVLIFLRVPIAFSMALVGLTGLATMRGWPGAFAMVGGVVRESGFQYLLSVVPLFILMGNFITHAGLSRELYAAAYAFLGHRRGGLAMSTVVACGGFGAVCGSSLATAATMSKVAYPEMRKLGYSDGLASGSIAAGGTLGILIPPSIVMVVYAILTEQSIGKMFAAGILPGLVAILFYLGAVRWTVWRNADAGPPGRRMPWPERLRALREVWGVLVLFAVVMGGIYGGVFSSTEAAGIGACGAFVFALLRGRLTWKVLSDVLLESSRTTGMLFLVLIGALTFANFINFTTLPADLQEYVRHFGIRPLFVILLICAIYIVLGCLMESMSMILLTVPLFYPLVQFLGYDLIWFGILVVVVTEISFITPPVGMNVMVLKSLLPDVSMGTLFRGVGPFVVADLLRLAVLIAFPSIALLLPRFVA
ncbi:TRAP transporter large permease [Ramlibacter sp. USB13]|uniref:TRAP transporter large permease protein n=1 Tax=Ramlibacter cellulosilyticus TaxID=2764187 RepID=A0A923MUX6_9BURK|nr:TRAP transporter large permease [Ramlibacter cellulosilyticus]MBC5784639.1 TRAP transporter large permease [Ramlibacter cellulosilyticus]